MEKEFQKIMEKVVDIFLSCNIIVIAVRNCGCSSSGRAPPCQGGGSEFEPRHPLQSDKKSVGKHAGAFFVE